ncbi:hypothetical protein CA838_03485 [Eikenella corrodens]|nr:hypothetical protein CA838_03485 [Eikenella corrodens]
MQRWAWREYSELNLNQYSVGSPCRTICTVCGSSPCPDLNLIHYTWRCGQVSFWAATRFQVASFRLAG